MSWEATVLTLFPEMFPGPLGLSLAGKALGARVKPRGAAIWPSRLGVDSAYRRSLWPRLSV